MEEAEIIVNTSMSREDYEKFLFISTFRKNKFTIPIIIVISLISGLYIGYNGGIFSPVIFLLGWISILIFTILVLVLKIKRRTAQRFKTDKTGSFDSLNVLKFYGDRIVMESEDRKSRGELGYDQFHGLMETRDFFIFYLTGNQASLIKKEDLEDLDEFRNFISGKFKGNYRAL